MEKVLRKPEEIQTEFNILCAQSGEKNYQLSVIQKDIRKINARIRLLNVEMGQALEAKAAAEAATKVSEVSNEQSSESN